MKLSAHRIILLGGIFFLATALGAQEASQGSLQETSLEELPGLRERAVVMNIISRIVEQNQEVVWNMENTRATIPGRPVGLRLVSSNLVVAVQFTPFLQESGQHILVAQAQIWMSVPGEGISYYTTIQTIPLGFGEQVYFFPLGPKENMEADEAHIEIQLALEPYSESSAPVNSGRDRDRDRRRNAPPQ